MKRILLTSLSFIALMSPAMAESSIKSNGQASASVSEMNLTKVENEMQYRTNLMALGNMSLMASQIAADKTSNEKVKEFAMFEISEQKAISSVLKDMKTDLPGMAEKDKSTLAQMKSAKGADFDKAYLEASLSTHQKLKDLNENFLNTKASNVAAKHARHLATISLPTIEQHIAQSKEMIGMLE